MTTDILAVLGTIWVLSAMALATYGLIAGYRRETARRKAIHPSTRPVAGHVVVHSDGPLDTDDLAALRHLLTGTLQAQGEAIYQAILDQVAADEAAWWRTGSARASTRSRKPAP